MVFFVNMYKSRRLTSEAFKTRKQDFIFMATEKNSHVSLKTFCSSNSKNKVSSERYCFIETSSSPARMSIHLNLDQFERPATLRPEPDPLSHFLSSVNGILSDTVRFVNKVRYQHGNHCSSVSVITAVLRSHFLFPPVTQTNNNEKKCEK